MIQLYVLFKDHQFYSSMSTRPSMGFFGLRCTPAIEEILIPSGVISHLQPVPGTRSSVGSMAMSGQELIFFYHLDMTHIAMENPV